MLLLLFLILLLQCASSLDVVPLVDAERAVAGARAAIVRSAVRIASHPLDTAKTRAQLGIAKKSTPFAGVGMTLAQLPAGAIMVTSFDALRAAGVPRPIASAVASVPSLLIKVPLERLKQFEQAGVRGNVRYSGGVAHAAREFSFNAIQLGLFDATDGSPWARGAAAAAVAAVATHPIDVVKTRTMASSITEIACVRAILANEGVRAFALGIVPRVLHSAVGGAAFFGVLDS
ncbi:hypothetical protein CTAYLR_003476 [Chrysophaeum taylorii]|uniref:Uncharacterized protein n=1 Tax=Chrysophaeum taylorii TaxID=2483200 RepID=A0AAD7XJ68_9STRA|nr:hypothetical protein CTAYLR_003476 [Chrysophaeum taylorii]